MAALVGFAGDAVVGVVGGGFVVGVGGDGRAVGIEKLVVPRVVGALGGAGVAAAGQRGVGVEGAIAARFVFGPRMVDVGQADQVVLFPGFMAKAGAARVVVVVLIGRGGVIGQIRGAVTGGRPAMAGGVVAVDGEFVVVVFIGGGAGGGADERVVVGGRIGGGEIVGAGVGAGAGGGVVEVLGGDGVVGRLALKGVVVGVGFGVGGAFEVAVGVVTAGIEGVADGLGGVLGVGADVAGVGGASARMPVN
jgi:hypothetical protein